MRQADKRRVEWQYNAIQQQLQERADEIEVNRKEQKALDQACLRETAYVQNIEEQRKKEKYILNR